MATTSEIKAGMDDIAKIIRAERNKMKDVKASAQSVSTELSNITTKYADVIATIDGFSVATTNDFEKMAKAEKAKLAAEFSSLKTKADQVSAIDMST